MMLEAHLSSPITRRAPRAANQPVSGAHAPAPALYLHTGADCATRRSGQSAS